MLDLEPPDLPRVAEPEPAVGPLRLPAADDLLVEDAELVPDSVADGGIVERRQRVHEAGREAPQAAVAEAGSSSCSISSSRLRPSDSIAFRAGASIPRLKRLLPSCGPIRYSAER